MKITVNIKPNSRTDKVELQPDGSYKVSVKARPVDGAANQALIKVLAEHLKIPKSRLSIKSGLRSKRKIVEIAC